MASIGAVSAQLEATGDDRSLDHWGYLVVAVAAGALAARRRWPLATVAAVTAALTLYEGRGYPGGPVFVTLFVAVYSLAVVGDRRRAYLVAAAASGWLVLAGLATHSGTGLVHLVFVGWAAAAVFLGDAVRSRREHQASLEQRALDLERTRDEEARRRVSEERLRIARDLHDSVAHAMAAINVQAGVAAHVMDRDPSQAHDALVVIKDASREVLVEMGALLGLLRGPGDGAERAPTPGLERLDDLLTSSRQAGLRVTLHGTPPDDVPHPVAVAAYRIVQESLTNVIRHAGREASATVRVSGNGDGTMLAVQVDDDGTGNGTGTGESAGAAESAAGAGVGIIGMRERAETTGGTFEAGAGSGGGFRVRATWPAAP